MNTVKTINRQLHELARRGYEITNPTHITLLRPNETPTRFGVVFQGEAVAINLGTVIHEELNVNFKNRGATAVTTDLNGENPASYQFEWTYSDQYFVYAASANELLIFVNN